MGTVLTLTSLPIIVRLWILNNSACIAAAFPHGHNITFVLFINYMSISLEWWSLNQWHASFLYSDPGLDPICCVTLAQVRNSIKSVTTG